MSVRTEVQVCTRRVGAADQEANLDVTPPPPPHLSPSVANIEKGRGLGGGEVIRFCAWREEEEWDGQATR